MNHLKGKHLSLDNRIEIQLGLKKGLSLVDIAANIAKNPRTVSFEIKRHLIKKVNHRYLHSQSVKSICLKHKKFPFVCDACLKIKSCTADLYTYEAKTADAIYKRQLVESRQGANLDLNHLTILNDVVKKCVSLGQSLEHIHDSHDLPCSVRSTYRHISNGILDTKSFNLRMRPRLKLRKVSKPINNDYAYLKGRLFIDYLAFIAKRPGTFTTQIDTVEGTKNDTKVILTIIIIELHFFYAFILERQSLDAVIKAFQSLFDMLGLHDFNMLFPVILTDRGNEFKSLNLSTQIDSSIHNKLFFCDPMASYQKGAIESYHRLLRFIFPKGKSLDFLTQDKLIHAISALNSYKIRSNQMLPAFDLVKSIFGDSILSKLKVRKIDPDSICLTPSLVK